MCSNPKRKAKQVAAGLRRPKAKEPIHFIMYTDEEMHDKVAAAQSYNQGLRMDLNAMVRRKRITQVVADERYEKKCKRSVKFRHLKDPTSLNGNLRIAITED